MLTIRLDSSVPLVDQIERGIRRAIADGTLVPGAELPPVRQLGADLGIHWNTVARAYRALEACGLVRTERGRGTRVVADREQSPESPVACRERLSDGLSAALADARLAGLTRRDVERLVSGAIAALWGSRRTVRPSGA